MLEMLLIFLHNWFRVKDDVEGKHPGTYTISGGNIALPFLQEGQYYRIIGSVFNNGLHKYGESDLTDETFDGTIWALDIPKAVEAEAERLAEWQTKYGDVISGPYSSESFGGYSYSKAAWASEGGSGDTWKNEVSAAVRALKKMPGGWDL